MSPIVDHTIREHPRGTEGSWSRRADVLSRDTIDGFVLLCANSHQPILLTGTAASVWELLGQPTRLGDVASTLADVYGVDGQQVLSQVRLLLAELCGLGAVECLR